MGYNNERKIAWFRQAEIKHGRVAMAAFVGYCVQANGGHWSFPMTLGGADWPTGTPPEQWDALPQASKWQIILSSACSSSSTSPARRITRMGASRASFPHSRALTSDKRDSRH